MALPSGKTAYATVIMGNGNTYYLWIDDDKQADYKPQYLKQFFRNLWAGAGEPLIVASTSSTTYDEIWLFSEEIDTVQIGIHPPA